MENISYVLERMYHISYIPLRYIDAEEKRTLFSIGCDKDSDPILLDNDLLGKLCKNSEINNIPILETEDNLFLYSSFRDTDGNFVLIGPALAGEISGEVLTGYKNKHHITSKVFHVKKCNIPAFLSVTALVCYTITGKAVTDIEILKSDNSEKSKPGISTRGSDVQSYLLDITENELPRYTYRNEREFMRPIVEGKPELLEKAADLSEYERVGKQASRPIKQYEYTCCASITLCARAAIQGGLDPSMAYAMADISKQRLEKCVSVADIIKLQKDIMIAFARQVKFTQEEISRNSYIGQCKSYILNHLNTPFTLDDIAGKIGINKSYLSRLFSEKEGIGIQKYTQIRRVETAADMLKYSDKSLTEIASYLCFPSQSYLGKVFKEHFGITPQKYREREKIQEQR